MTLCRRGRSVFVLTLVRGVVTVSIIPGSISWSVFKRSGKGPDGGACVDQLARHSVKAPRRHLIAALGGRLDQFTGSRLVLELGIARPFQAFCSRLGAPGVELDRLVGKGDRGASRDRSMPRFSNEAANLGFGLIV